MISRALRILLIASVALVSCKEDEKTGAEMEREARQTADSALLKDDPEKAASEFLDRLKRDVQRRDGLVYVNEPLLDTLEVFPAHVVWHLLCGLVGLSVSFGGGEETGGVDVVLTQAHISKDQCRELAPRIGLALSR